MPYFPELLHKQQKEMLARQEQEKAGVQQRAAARQSEVERLDIRKAAAWETKKAGYQSRIASQNLANQMATATRQVSAQQASAKAANIARQKRIESLYGEMMGMVQPGGAFEKRGLADIERQKTKGVGQEMQQMISSGMYGTTTAAGVGRGWEADVGAPARLRLEDIMQQRQLGVMGQKAGFLERIEDVYPDYQSLLQMLSR